MRIKPISTEIIEADDLKTLHTLNTEVKELLLKVLKTDKRTLRGEGDKERFKAKMDLYCRLYRASRDKFILVRKRDSEGASYYKTPTDLDEVIKDFNWEKTVRYSKPSKGEDDFGEFGRNLINKTFEESNFGENKDTLHLEGSLLTNKKIDVMKSLFNRQDKATIEAAMSSTLEQFLETYKGATTVEVLTRAYNDIRAKNSGKETSQVVTERVGEEGTTETLEAKTATTGSTAPSAEKLIKTPTQAEIVDFINLDDSAKDLKERSDAILKDQTLSEAEAEQRVDELYTEAEQRLIAKLKAEAETTTSTTTVVVHTPGGDVDVTTTTTVKVEPHVEEPKVEEPVVEKKATPAKKDDTPKQPVSVEVVKDKAFKETEKSYKESIVKAYFDAGYTKCGDVVTKMKEDGFVINHYDDVYNVFTKVQKAAAKEAEAAK